MMASLVIDKTLAAGRSPLRRARPAAGPGQAAGPGAGAGGRAGTGGRAAGQGPATEGNGRAAPLAPGGPASAPSVRKTGGCGG